ADATKQILEPRVAVEALEIGPLEDKHKVANALLISLFQPLEGAVAISQGGIDMGKCRRKFARLLLAFKLCGNLSTFVVATCDGIDQSKSASAPHRITR